MQVLTKVPTISIDKTDGCQIYLNQASLDVSIVSAKSSEMNVLVPKADGDYVSYTFKSYFMTLIIKFFKFIRWSIRFQNSSRQRTMARV